MVKKVLSIDQEFGNCSATYQFSVGAEKLRKEVAELAELAAYISKKENIKKTYLLVEKKIIAYFNRLSGTDNRSRYEQGKVVVAVGSSFIPVAGWLSKSAKLKKVLQAMQKFTKGQWDEFFRKVDGELGKGLANAAGEWLTALKSANYKSLRKHLFEGDILGGKVTGCHYRQAVDGVNIRFADDAIPDGNSLGVLKGDIEFRREIFKPGKVSFDPPQYKWTKKNIPSGDPQTFFPSTWSKEKILEECSSALANSKKQLVPGKSRMYEAESNSGVFMRWFEDVDGNVTSIFPEF